MCVHQLQEDKRRALVLKAKSDRLKKRAEVKHLQRAILTQRKLAQRQRRERERVVMRQARERQDKISRQKEVEVREKGGREVRVCTCVCVCVCAGERVQKTADGQTEGAGD